MAELEETLRAIRSGEVDALVVETNGEDRVFTLKSADHAYRLIVEQMQMGAATLSEDGVVLYCNPFLAALLDVPEEAILGTWLSRFLDGPGVASLTGLLQAAGSGFSRGEVSFRRGGGLVLTQVSFTLLPLEGARVFCLIVTDLTDRKRREDERAQLEREQVARASAEEANRTAQDEIDRRKRVEESLRTAHEQLSTVLASITDAYLVIDHDWRLLATNSVAESMIFQRPASELLGRVVWPTYPEGADPEFQRQCQRAVDDGQAVHFEARSEVAGRWFEAHAYPREDRLEIYLRDITERRRAEEERAALLERERLARADAEAANRLKDEFLATLSHELRSPLHAIVAWSHLLREPGSDPGTVSRAVEAIHRNAQAQAQLVSDILDVSRIITGQFRISRSPVGLAELIESAVDTVRLAAEARGIQLNLAIDPAAGAVLGDASRLQQVIWNLLSNAIRFAPVGGQVEVRVEAAGSCIELSVTDDGPGIDPAFLPYIFDRFRQADASSTRRHAGLGLGLAIVRHLVELHGGTVEARNREGRSGAVFIVRLQRGQGVSIDTTPAEGRAPTKAGPEEAQAAPSLAGVSVLVVDDEEDTREAMAIGLGRYGARVATSSCVREALDALERERPHVLVADIGMPGEDGYALLQRVRALPAERGGATPAIALTAYASAQDRLDALRTGFQMHVPKPVTPGELAIVVARVMAPAGPRATSR
ncbi:MAG TPA: ATP-binding protein [Vicinamibacteria bacterium]|nr:ATP-binding protein [Vicinamibacteria bacterium]